MDRRQREQARLACRVSLGLMAGIFSVVPVVSASPVQDTSASAPKLGDFHVDQTTTANVTAITSNDKNNIVPWTDFSVASGETVKFDDGNKTNNYLNIVTGANASVVNGAIKGGNDVYLVNPHGVLIGKNANVDVGNLYVSTQDTTSAVSEFTNNGSTGSNVIAGTANADVVNLGTLSAQNVEVVGENITFTTTSKVTATAGNVTLTASGDVTNLGKITATAGATTGDVNISGENIYLMNVGTSATAAKSTVTADNINLVATTNLENFGTLTANNGNIDISGTDIKLMDTADVTAAAVTVAAGGTARIGTTTSVGKGTYTTPSNYTTSGTVKNFGTIKTAADLTYVNNKLSGDYEMANDVNWSGNAPIGTSAAFTGTFDGNYHTVNNIRVTSGTYGGLFGQTNGATIKNVGVKGGFISLAANAYAGGIVGYAVNTTLENVFNEGAAISLGPKNTGWNAGGIAGYANGGSITTAYNTGSYSTRGGGIVGVTNGVTIKNVYNESTANSGVIIGSTQQRVTNDSTTVDNAYTLGPQIKTQYFQPPTKTNPITNTVTNASSMNAASYGDLTGVSDSGSVDTTWRIYEGHTRPLLRAFLRRGRGAVKVNYDYDHGTENGKAVTGTNGGKDLDVTYNGNDLTLSNVMYAVSGMYVDESKISPTTLSKLHDANVYTNDTSYNANGTVYKTDTSNGVTYFYTGQNGYDLVGDKVFIRQRTVNVQNALQNSTITKEYDGTKNLTTADIQKLLAGSSSSGSGLIANDTTARLDASGLTGTFDDENVGANKTVTLNGGITLQNLTTHHNYAISQGSTSFNNVQRPGIINPRQLVVDLTSTKSSVSKTYDGTADAGTVQASDFALQTVNTAATSTVDTDNVVIKNGAKEDVQLGLMGNQQSFYGTYNATANTFTPDADAGSKDVQYNGLYLTGGAAHNYVLVDTKGNKVFGQQYNGAGADINLTTGGTIYGTGKIDPRVIDTSVFTVQDANGNTAAPTKVYDGSSTYTLPSGSTLVQGTSTLKDSGVVKGENITFAINGANSYFTDASGNATSQVADAKGAAIGITATAGTGTKLSNYVWGTPTATGATTATTGSLLSVQPTNSIKTTGSIKPRDITVAVTQPSTTIITKDYDGTTAVNYTNYPRANTFGSAGYVDYATGSLNLADGTNGTTADGTSFKVTAAYDSKDVNRANNNPQGAVLNRNIDYTIEIAGANAANYTLNGTQLTSSANSITILGSQSGAQGLINPKNLSSSFAKVSKTYDGNANMPTGFQTTKQLTTNDGAIVSAGASAVDDVVLNIGSATYQSKNVNGDGTTKVINNVTQKNWVNYTGLSLSGNDAGNYAVNATASGEGEITPLTLKAGDFTYTIGSLTKEYDGTTTITSADAQAGLTGVTVTNTGDVFKGKRTTTNSSGQTVSTPVDFTQNVSATYKDANSNNQTAQDVNYTVTVVDDGSGNYVMPSGGITETPVGTGKGVITPRVIEAHIVDSDLTKTYDADTAATANTSKGNQYLINYTYAGTNPNATTALVGSDKDASTGVYVTKGTTTADADASAVKGKDVIYTLKTSATDSSNYKIVDSNKNVISTLTGDGTINKRDLKVTFNNVSKAYDGTGTVSDANITSALQLDDGANNAVITKDGLLKDFNAAPAGSTTRPITGAYQDATGQYNVGSYAVNYTNVLAALGTHAKNYNISTLSSKANGGTIASTGDITKLTLGNNFIFDFNTISKEYDGNNQVAHTDAGGTYHSRESYIGNHYVDMNNNGTYDAGTDIQLSGITATTATYKSANSNNGASQAVNYDLSFGNLGNYNIANGASWTHGGTTLTYNNNAFTATTTGTITPRKVVASVVDHNLTKTYDGTTAARQNGTTPFLSYEHYIAPNKTGGAGSGLVLPTDKDASTGVYGATADASLTSGDKTVTYTPIINNASNYEIVDGATGTKLTTPLQDAGTINKRKVLFTFTDTRKTWDGLAAATADLTAPTVTFDDSNAAGNTDGQSGIITSDGAGAAFQKNLAADPGKYGTYSQTNVTWKGPDTVTYDLTELFRMYDASGNLLTDYGKNYDFAPTGTGNGYIDQLVINNPNDFHFNFNTITKEYDNTTDVGYTDRSGNAITAGSFVKDSYVMVNNKKINLGGWTATGSYQSVDSNNSTPQAVSYTVNFGANAGSNFTLGNFTRTGQNTAADPTLVYNNGVLSATTQGTITPRTVYASLTSNPTQVTKTYNGLTDILQNGSAQNIMGDVQMNGLLAGTAHDDGVRLNTAASQAAYADKNAGTKKDIRYKVELLAGNQGGKISNYNVVDANGNALATNSANIPILTSTGTGTINKAQLSVDFGRVEKVYDTSADVTSTSPANMSGTTQTTATAITPTLFGFVAADNMPSLAMNNSGITGEYAAWDATKNTAVADENVRRDANGNVLDKGVMYSGIAQAFNTMASSQQYQSLLQNYDLTGGYIATGSTSGAAATVLSSNNGIADTVYFNEAAAKGQIKPLALTQGALVDQWNGPITKVYDGTADVKDPTRYMTLFVADPTNTTQPLIINGKTFAVGYTLNGARYMDAAGKDQINQTGNVPVSVEYTVNGLSQTSLNNFSTPLSFNNTYAKMSIGTITPRTIYGNVQQTQDVNKTYDSTKAVDAAGLANLAITHTETDASGKTITNTGDGILASDAALGIRLTKAGTYDNANATIKQGDAATNTRNITYTMTLADPTGLGNYVLDPSYPNGYAATGDIYRAAIKVHSDAKTSTEGTTPSGYTGKTTGWYSDADHTAYQAGGGDANITWNIKPGQDATRRGTYGIYGWYLGQKFPVQQVSQTTDPTTGAVLTTTETITNPVTNTVITRVTDAKTKVTTYQDANGKTLPASAVIGWFDFSNDPTQTADPNWASSGLASYYLVGSDNHGLFGTNYYFEQDPSDLTVHAASHGGGGGGGTVTPVQPVRPVNPVTPSTPDTPVTPVTPNNQVTPDTPVDREISEATNAAKQFVPNTDAYNNVSHDDFGSVTRSGQAGIEYASGGINVAGAAETPTVSTSDVDNAAIGLQNAGSIVNLSGGDAMEVSASRIDLTGNDSFTVTVDDGTTYDSSAAIETTGAQAKDGAAAVDATGLDAAGAQMKDGAAAVDTTALDATSTLETTSDATTAVETVASDTTLTEMPAGTQDTLQESMLPSADDSEGRDAQAEVRSAEADVTTETAQQVLTTEEAQLFGDEMSTTEQTSQTQSSSEARETSLFANAIEEDETATPSDLSTQTAEDTASSEDAEETDDEESREADSSEAADDSAIGIESEGAGVKVA